MNTSEARFLVDTYAEMLYAYSGCHSWADMSDDRKPFLDRAERELQEMGKI
jgi:hypothetical protein